MIHNLFPTPVGFYELERSLTDEEVSFVDKHSKETYKNTGNATSLEKDILGKKEMEGLKSFIDASLEDFLKTVYVPKEDVKLDITQSWLNYTEKGEWHHKHAHPNSFISGVFYPKANKETDKIYFYNDSYKQIKLPPQEWNMWNSDSWWFPVASNSLILFPSSLQHMVEEVISEETRVSLAFNTFPVGNIGAEDMLTALRINKASGMFI